MGTQHNPWPWSHKLEEEPQSPRTTPHRECWCESQSRNVSGLQGGNHGAVMAIKGSFTPGLWPRSPALPSQPAAWTVPLIRVQDHPW